MPISQVFVIALKVSRPYGISVDPSQLADVIAEAITLKNAQQPAAPWLPLPESVTVYECAYDAGIEEASLSGPWEPEV